MWAGKWRSRQKREREEPQCYVGEGEEIPEVQGEEEEGYPSDVRFRLASPMDASGTGGPLGAPGWCPDYTRASQAKAIAACRP